MNQDDRLAIDMKRFIASFCNVISQSVPHIYLSALPFSPRSSLVSNIYSGRYPKTIGIQNGGQSDWPDIQNILVGHDWIVTSVAFSADGKRILSGSRDDTILVWNSETGEIVAGPFKEHVDWLNSVAFSPNGKHVVSGSKDGTIRVWDSRTGTETTCIGPFESYLTQFTSVSFSPEGSSIVSGSTDAKFRCGMLAWVH